MNAPIVFQTDSLAIETEAYRSAVEQIITDIQNATEDDLVEIAENIRITVNTVWNAKHKRTSLGAEYLARLGRFYGAGFLNPYFALFGAQAQPLPPKPTSDILPVLTGLTHDIAYARSPESPGGTTEVPQEKRKYLHKAKTLQREIGCLIREVEAA